MGEATRFKVGLAGEASAARQLARIRALLVAEGVPERGTTLEMARNYVQRRRLGGDGG